MSTEVERVDAPAATGVRDVVGILEAARPWTASPVPPEIPYGDMPGDQVRIGATQVAKAATLLPPLAEHLLPVLARSACSRAVVAVAGGSGVGKSEIASLLAFQLRSMGIGTYTLSGDNYPHRIPRLNDAERLRVFRRGGLRGLIASGLHTPQRSRALLALQVAGVDADRGRAAGCEWLAVYQDAGRTSLAGYLGTRHESDFAELSAIVRRFTDGADALYLRRMGREEADVWYDLVDVSDVHVLVIEWTHGLSDALVGVDVPILLVSTPAETLEHRRARNRDGGVDSPFTALVLEIEQELLDSRAHTARIVLSKGGELRSPDVRRHAGRAGEVPGA